jgi:hypothetical protein
VLTIVIVIGDREGDRKKYGGTMALLFSLFQQKAQAKRETTQVTKFGLASGLEIFLGT